MASAPAPRTRFDRAAQAHLALQLFDLLDLLADLHFQFGVDFFLDRRPRGLVVEVVVDLVQFVEVDVDLVEVVVEVVDATRERRGGLAEAGRFVEFGVERLGLAAGRRLALGTVALATATAAAHSVWLPESVTSALRAGTAGDGTWSKKPSFSS